MKEPWEMIRKEFIGLTEIIDGKPIGGRYKGESDYNKLIASRSEKELKSIERLIEQENPPISFIKGKMVWNPIYSPENEHRAFVKLALSGGKPVPSEVLKDYPDLVASVSHEPVKGEQPGMLGVPGKYVEQKRPWTPGQIEIESYTKYKEAMRKHEEVTSVKKLIAERDSLEQFMREQRQKISDIEYRRLEKQLSEVDLAIARFGLPQAAIPKAEAVIPEVTAREAALQMTQKEYADLHVANWGKGGEEMRGRFESDHYRFVRRAVSEGELVPAKVLAGYPDLAKALPKPEAKSVTPEVTVPTAVAKAIEGKTINDITIKKVRGTWWAVVTDTEFPIVGLTSKIETEAYIAKMFKLAIPKAEAKVGIEAMKRAEKPGKNLYWYSIAELKKMCQTKGLSIGGSKESLIQRLR